MQLIVCWCDRRTSTCRTLTRRCETSKRCWKSTQTTKLLRTSWWWRRTRSSRFTTERSRCMPACFRSLLKLTPRSTSAACLMCSHMILSHTLFSACFLYVWPIYLMLLARCSNIVWQHVFLATLPQVAACTLHRYSCLTVSCLCHYWWCRHHSDDVPFTWRSPAAAQAVQLNCLGCCKLQLQLAHDNMLAVFAYIHCRGGP